MSDANFDPSDLRQAFERARDIFNAGPIRYDELKSLFHEDIVYSRIHSPAWWKGCDTVIGWLKSSKQTEQPRFYPDMQQAFPSSKSPGGTIQHVGGTARWERAGYPDEEIEYMFTFVRGKEGDPWLLIDAHGHVKGGHW
jgi:hypothetical protein